MADRGEAARRKETGEEGSIGDRHVHLAVPFHPPAKPLLRLSFGHFDHAGTQRVLEDHRQDRDHQQPTGKLRGEELPAEQHEDHQAQLED